MKLVLPDSGAETLPDGRRHVPSAERNAAPILALLHQVLPARGRLLELAAGSGLHSARFAAALPGLDWQPTDVEPENFASIRAWTAGHANVRPPRLVGRGCKKACVQGQLPRLFDGQQKCHCVGRMPGDVWH